MAENTKIEWCDHTFNPWEGCQKVGPGCDHCYAETRNARFGGGVAVNWGPGAPRRRTSKANWKLPLKWNAEAEQLAKFGLLDHRPRVFCASLADVFDNQVPPEWRADLFALIAVTPNLDWLLLTKRIGNVLDMVPRQFIEGSQSMGIPSNVWIGATIVNQEEADRDIPKLLAVPAAKRFLSMEPLLGPVNISFQKAACLNGCGDIYPLLCNGDKDLCCPDCGSITTQCSPVRPKAMRGIDWVIVGGESGPGARPMHPDWARSLRNQCQAAGVPFLFKQWGEWGEPDSIESTGIAHNGWWEQDRADGGVPRYEWTGPMLDGVELTALRPEVFRVGKKAAGRLLDGRTHDEFPGAQHG